MEVTVLFMNWQVEWKAIAGRISGITAAGELLARAFQVSSEDPYNAAIHLSEQAIEILSDLTEFRDRAVGIAPQKAVEAISTFLDKHGMRLNDSSLRGVERLKVSIVPLAWLRAEIDYHLSDFESVAKRLSERAFVHLQQLIVADDSVRSRWQDAFKAGETACEKLGGAHLLLHGIWAFKVNGPKAETDLVFGEPLGSGIAIERAAEALVLTEWKKVRKKDNSNAIAKQARSQAQTYAVGIMAGIELISYRYIVLVSEKQLPSIDDVCLAGVTYRHINVSVDPYPPSRAT
jgi:hypothetical protein